MDLDYLLYLVLVIVTVVSYFIYKYKKNMDHLI